jgi:hypothetical protein
VVVEGVARLTRVFAVLNGETDAAIAQDKLLPNPGTVANRRRLLLQLRYLDDPQR